MGDPAQEERLPSFTETSHRLSARRSRIYILFYAFVVVLIRNASQTQAYVRRITTTKDLFILRQLVDYSDPSTLRCLWQMFYFSVGKLPGKSWYSRSCPTRQECKNAGQLPVLPGLYSSRAAWCIALELPGLYSSRAACSLWF